MLNTDLHAFAMSQPDFNVSSKNCHNEAWVQQKDQFNGGDDPRTASGKKNLVEVTKHLKGKASPLYDVYGVVEMWNETMTLFDDKLPLAKSWVGAGGKLHAGHGSRDYKAEEEKLLAQAKKDPVILEELQADITLYHDVIVPMFMAAYKKLEVHEAGTHATAAPQVGQPLWPPS